MMIYDREMAERRKILVLPPPAPPTEADVEVRSICFICEPFSLRRLSSCFIICNNESLIKRHKNFCLLTTFSNIRRASMGPRGSLGRNFIKCIGGRTAVSRTIWIKFHRPFERKNMPNGIESFRIFPA